MNVPTQLFFFFAGGGPEPSTPLLISLWGVVTQQVPFSAAVARVYAFPLLVRRSTNWDAKV